MGTRLTWNLALAAAVSLPAAARAGVASRLEYSRTAEAAHCPGEAELRNAVAARLGYDPFFPWAPQRIVVELAEDQPGTVRARVRLVDSTGIVRGQREIADPRQNCSELIASVALAISITLDPMATPSSPPVASVESQEPEREPAAPPHAAPEPAAFPGRESPVPAPARAPAPGDAWEVAVRLGTLGAVGAEPLPTFGARAGVGLARGPWGLLAEVRADLPQSARAAREGAVSAGLVAGAILPCFSRGFLSGCGELVAGSLSTRGTEVAAPRSALLFYMAAGARFEAHFDLDARWALVAGADALWTLTPLVLALQGEEVWRTPRVSFGAGAGVAFRIP